MQYFGKYSSISSYTVYLKNSKTQTIYMYAIRFSSEIERNDEKFKKIRQKDTFSYLKCSLYCV